MQPVMWFGSSWGAPVCELEHVPAPTHLPCIYCEEKVVKGDRGLLMPNVGGEHGPWAAAHIDCFLLAVLGPDAEGEMIERHPAE